MKKNAFSVLALAVAATLFFSACSKNESEKVTLMNSLSRLARHIQSCILMSRLSM